MTSLTWRLLADGEVLAERTTTVGDRVTLGRRPPADLVLAEVTVARSHAAIVHGEAGLALEDLESPGGTYVDGRLARGPVALADGARLRVGRLELVLSLSGAPPSRAR